MSKPIETADVSPVTCVGVLMDGNRRWARACGKASVDGYGEGYKKLQEVLRWAGEAGISHVVAYAFSTENWQRPKEEVGYLMKLFRSVLENETGSMITERIRVRFVADRSRFSADIQKMMTMMEEATVAAYDLTLHLLVSYGGRAEVLAAVNALVAEQAANVTEESFVQKLWSHAMPDPDIIIRTGGEKRLSNFLPWQSGYSEIFFTDTLWPDFTKKAFNSILAEFATRERRRGK